MSSQAPTNEKASPSTNHAPRFNAMQTNQISSLNNSTLHASTQAGSFDFQQTNFPLIIFVSRYSNSTIIFILEKQN